MTIENTSAADEAVRIAAVVVTYGDRLALVRQVAAALDANDPAIHLVVVDNGALVRPTAAHFGQRDALTIVTLPSNQGSAAGFAAGITAAANLAGITHLLLFDDDTTLAPGGIAAIESLLRSLGDGHSTVLSILRHGRREYVAYLAGERARQIRPNSFLGFHLAEIGDRLLRRLRPGVQGERVGPSRVREAEVAPYGGLLVPAALARRVEPPRTDFVLYSDDHDYVMRLRQAGARVYLTDVTGVRDVETSWNEASEDTGNNWVGRAASPWRTYYAVRNRMLIEKAFTTSRLVYAGNRLASSAVLALAALRAHGSLRAARAALLPVRQALADAAAGRLGFREPYRLPGQPADAERLQP